MAQYQLQRNIFEPELVENFLELLEILQNSNGYDSNYVPVIGATWCDYEESGYMVVLVNQNNYYIQHYQYSVMSDDNEDRFEPYSVTQAQALQELMWYLEG